MPHATRDGRPVHPYTDLCPEHAGFLVYDFLRTLALPRDSLSDRARLRRLVLLGQERTHQCRHQCGRATPAGVETTLSTPTDAGRAAQDEVMMMLATELAETAAEQELTGDDEEGSA